MLELLKSQLDTGIGIATAVIGLFVLAIRSGFQIFALYEQHWSRRHYKILTELRATESNNCQLNGFLNNALHVESFRIASGVSANRITTDYLMRLDTTRVWNRYQIKQISKYIVTFPDASKAVFRITGWQAAGARAALAYAGVFVAFGLFFGHGIIVKGANTLTGLLAGIGIEIVFLVAGGWIGSPYRSYRIARSFEAYLKKHPEILAENETATAEIQASLAVDQATVSPPSMSQSTHVVDA